MKIAVVTPYYREDPKTLRRCIDSVRAQTVPAQHYLVADGEPDPAIAADPGLRHLMLPCAHKDYGGTARAVGSLAAAMEGADAIAWLDADNWYRPAHLETLVAKQAETGKPLIAAWRTMHRPDGSVMEIDSREERRGSHVDTNCWLVMRAAFDLLTVWLMPAGLSIIGDRVFFEAAKRRGFTGAMTGQKTVCYTSLYRTHYKELNEPPPPDAKDGVIEAGRAYLENPAHHDAIIAALGFLPTGNFPQR